MVYHCLRDQWSVIAIPHDLEHFFDHVLRLFALTNKIFLCDSRMIIVIFSYGIDPFRRLCHVLVNACFCAHLRFHMRSLEAVPT